MGQRGALIGLVQTGEGESFVRRRSRLFCARFAGRTRLARAGEVAEATRLVEPGLREADQILRAVPVVFPKVTRSHEMPHHPGNVIELFQFAGG
jgi:hypothetical protein